MLASDAFFPFPDGVEEAAEAGATAIMQPGGSVRDDEVIAAADGLGPRHGVHRRAALPALSVHEDAGTQGYVLSSLQSCVLAIAC